MIALRSFRRELRDQRLFRQQREHRFLVRKLGTEAVHDANLVILIRLHQRMIQREAQQELLRADPAINQIDIEAVGAQHAVPVFQLIRRYQFV